MKNLPSYEDYLILERNKAVAFFKDHPELLSKFSQGVDPHKENWDPKRHNIDTEIEGKRFDKLREQFARKLKSIPGADDVVMENPKGNPQWTVIELFSGKKEGWSSWYDHKYFVADILSSKDIDAFITKASVRGRSWQFPIENYSDRKDISQYPKLYKLLKDNWKKIQDLFKWYSKAEEGIKGSSRKGYINDLMKLGISERDVSIAMSHIQNWTSMSRKKLDPQTWPLLQKISVDDSKLPKYIYRGIFYDGAKIKDETKFLEKWKAGSQPGDSQGKATSWSIDRGTAASFMTDQDFIKDRQKGYYVLLKWKVDPKLVICDLRNLPVDHTFWNQQEIIVDPAARDYEVDTIIPGTSGSEGLKEFEATIKGGQGAWGNTRADFAKNFLRTPYETLSPSDRIEFKQISKMTVEEFRRAYPKANVTSDPDWQKIPFPIWSYLDRNMWGNAAIESVSGNVVKFYFEFSLDRLDYLGGSGSKVSTIYKKFHDSMNFNQFSASKVIKSDIGTIELVSDSYYDIEINITLPKKFSLVPHWKEGNKSDTSDRAKLADEGLQKILDEVGDQGFIDSARQNMERESVARNMQVTIK